MTFDVKPLLRGEVGRIAVDCSFSVEPITGVSFESDAHAVGEITDNGGYMRLRLHLSVPYTAACDRCLDEVRGVFDADFERTVVTRGSLTEEQLEENFDEYAVLDADGMLDVDREIAETMMLLFPKKILCAEDCEGLCPVCGKPRRLGDCGCVTKEIDPRLAILQKLLDNSEK